MDQQTPIDPTRTIEWLDKLIMLAQWDHKLPFDIVRLISEAQQYQDFLVRVRASVKDQTQLTENSTENTPLVLARKKLLEAVNSVPALRELFGAEQDPFDGATPDRLELLAEVSDVTSDSQRMVYSRSGTLMAKVEAIRQDQELDPVPLIVDGLNKFLTLIEAFKPAENEKSTAELLYELATSPHWYVVMASLRASLYYTSDEEPAAADALKQWNEKLSNTGLRSLFLKPGHLSRAPKKLIKLAWEQRALFDHARASIPENAREKDSDDERKQVVDAAFLLFETQFKTQLDEIKTDLRVLGTVAIHFVKVRKFAKFDGFVYTWPAIARLGRANYAALKYVEEQLLNRAPRPTDEELEAREARELYSLIEKDERLKRFMRLRPYFREISETELMDYRPLAPVIISSNRPASSIPESADPGPVRQQEPAPPPAPPPASFNVQTLSIAKAESQSSDQGTTYEVMFSRSGKTITGPVSFAVEKLLERILASMGVTSDSSLQQILKDLFTEPNVAEERIRRGANELVKNVLSVSTYDSIANVLATPTSEAVRLVVNSTEKEVHYLPWEWWPTSGGTLLLTSPGHSVIRRFKSPDEGLPALMFSPLRLLSFIPNAPSGTRFTSDITLKSLMEVFGGPGVQYPTQYLQVVREKATWENFRSQLESFKPHMVHFEGFLFSSSLIVDDEPTDVLLHLPDSDDERLSVESFADLLRSSGVYLLVIGRNGVSRIYQNACARAAVTLAEKGLSVIAPMRAIDDTSATTFTTEFYRAFLQGNTLESALHLARRNLASKGGDWSVFALFTDPDRLQYLELVRETA